MGLKWVHTWEKVGNPGTRVTAATCIKDVGGRDATCGEGTLGDNLSALGALRAPAVGVRRQKTAGRAAPARAVSISGHRHGIRQREYNVDNTETVGKYLNLSKSRTHTLWGECSSLKCLLFVEFSISFGRPCSLECWVW